MEQLSFFEEKKEKLNVKRKVIVDIEKVCLGIVLMAFSWILVYVWGYKNGYRKGAVYLAKNSTVLAKRISQEEFLPRSEKEPSESKNSSEDETSSSKSKEQPSLEPQPQEFYYLQLASYTNSRIASQYLQDLKQKGLKAYLKKRGKYYVLYVGNYSSWEEVSKVREELKGIFPDSILRRL